MSNDFIVFIIALTIGIVFSIPKMYAMWIRYGGPWRDHFEAQRRAKKQADAYYKEMQYFLQTGNDPYTNRSNLVEKVDKEI